MSCLLLLLLTLLFVLDVVVGCRSYFALVVVVGLVLVVGLCCWLLFVVCRLLRVVC